MSRLSVPLLWMGSLVLVGMLPASEVAAQREGAGRGRGRGFPVSSVRLAAASEVQAALSLSDEQKQKVDDINDKLRDDVRNAFQGGSGFEQVQKLNEDATAKLAEVLNEAQRMRLMGISVQVNGPGALAEPAVMAELKLSDEQKSKLAEIRAAGMQSFREAFQQMRDQNSSWDDMRAKFDELRAATDKNLLAVLTSEQQARLESLKGEPVEVDRSQFRGFGGRTAPARTDDSTPDDSEGDPAQRRADD